MISHFNGHLNTLAATLKFERFAGRSEEPARASVAVQADTPVLQIVLVNDENYCGPIGNRGKGFCNKKGSCTVAAHQRNRDPRFKSGFYVEVTDGWVLHEPFLDLPTAHLYEEQLRCLSNGAAKDIIAGVFNTIKALEKSKISPEESVAEICSSSSTL